MRLHNRVNRAELKQRMRTACEPRTTISFYRYVYLPNPQLFRDHLFLLWQPIGMLGRIYVAHEGINAQVSIPTAQLEAFKTSLESIDFLQNLRLNMAIEDDGKSFFALTIKVREKIVADGITDPTFDASNIGVHLKAQAFNTLIEQPDTVLIDMRNHYESEVGHFEGAICPSVDTFRDSLPIIEDMLVTQKDKNIVMYCTGGIRCEKASAFLKHKGFKNVFQLEGGIIEYARQIHAQGLPNKFVGKNFVFDERLGERISEQVIAHCHQCGTSCDHHTNCANDACHLLFIQCPSCAEVYAGTCSSACKDFIALPEDQQRAERKTRIFNGTKFGKGRYKPTATPTLA